MKEYRNIGFYGISNYVHNNVLLLEDAYTEQLHVFNKRNRNYKKFKVYNNAGYKYSFMM